MSLTIVLVDDDPESRLIVRRLLAPASDTMTIVGEAADGEEHTPARWHPPCTPADASQGRELVGCAL